MRRTIKILSAIAVVVALLLAGGSVPLVTATSGVTVSVDAPTGVAPDSDFTANVNISGVTDFDACNYDVLFDATVLRLDNITSGLIGSIEIPVGVYNEISPGTYRVVQNVPGLAGVSGSGYLAELHFHVIGSAGDSSLVGPSNGVLSDIAADEIEATWVGESVSIAVEVSQTTTPPPTADSSPEATTPPTGSTEPAPLLPPPPPAGPGSWPVLWWVIGGLVLLGLIIIFVVARIRAY